MQDFAIRIATVADAAHIAHHRVAMFTDMGRVRDRATATTLHDATLGYLARAMPAGEYVAWLAVTADTPERVIAGAGAQRRHTMPFPIRASAGVAAGSQAIVMNVYTEPDWRRRGVARALMEEAIAWARTMQLDVLQLHASSAGRPLYERLGFLDTNEMSIAP